MFPSATVIIAPSESYYLWPAWNKKQEQPHLHGNLHGILQDNLPEIG
jgi:hypothetical protein